MKNLHFANIDPIDDTPKPNCATRNIGRCLRHVTGIFGATLATLFFLAVLTAPLQNDPEITVGVIIITGLIGCTFAGIAYWLLRKTVPARIRPCPKCGGHECLPAGVLIRRRSLFLRHIGGFLLEALWGQSHRQQVACAGCETLYFTETKSTRAWGVAVWVFLLLLLIGALANQYLPTK